MIIYCMNFSICLMFGIVYFVFIGFLGILIGMLFNVLLVGYMKIVFNIEIGFV